MKTKKWKRKHYKRLAWLFAFVFTACQTLEIGQIIT